MSPWPDHSHFAAWGGLCPGNHESAGKRKAISARKEIRSSNRFSCKSPPLRFEPKAATTRRNSTGSRSGEATSALSSPSLIPCSSRSTTSFATIENTRNLEKTGSNSVQQSRKVKLSSSNWNGSATPSSFIKLSRSKVNSYPSARPGHLFVDNSPPTHSTCASRPETVSHQRHREHREGTPGSSPCPLCLCGGVPNGNETGDATRQTGTA